MAPLEGLGPTKNPGDDPDMRNDQRRRVCKASLSANILSEANMSKVKSRQRATTVLAAIGLTSGLLFLSSPAPAALANGAPPDPSVIRITPPAPVIQDKDRLAELAGRRARVA